MRWILACALTLTYGCGDADPASTRITAGYAPQPNVIPIDAAEATLEYTLMCQGHEDLEDDFGPGEPGPIDDDRVFVWTTLPLDLPPGPCSVVLRMRDAEREVICTAYEDFVVATDEPTEVDVVMGCELSPF